MSDEREGVTRLPGVHEPGMYRIRISGRIDPSWSDRAQGMDVVVRHTAARESFSELTGVVADQAALQGFIDLLYAHGHVLLGLEWLGEDGSLRPEWSEAGGYGTA